MEKKSHVSIRLFENPLLERLTHVHPILPLLFWTPIIGYWMWRSFEVLNLGPGVVGLMGFCGVLTWSLVEYLLHRYVFHYSAKTAFGKRLVYLFHGIHHEDSQDATRLVMPPAAGVIFATVFYYFFRLILGDSFVQPFFAFFLIGYLCYDYIHYSIHHFTPRTPVGRFLKHYHMQHHFVTPEARWGVSSPFWDYIFGTAMEHDPSSEPRKA